MQISYLVSGLHHAVSLGNIDAPSQVRINLTTINWPAHDALVVTAGEFQFSCEELRLGGWDDGATERPTAARSVQHKTFGVLQGGHHRSVLSHRPSAQQLHRGAATRPILRMLVDAQSTVVSRCLRRSTGALGWEFAGLRSDKQTSKVGKWNN